MRFLPLLLLTMSYCLAPKEVKAGNKDLSPLDFGLMQANNGIERYECLYRTHFAALKAGVNVSYKGIDSLHIEIPPDAKSIPLTDNNDFGGLVLIVSNKSKQHYVFKMGQKANEIAIDKLLIGKGDYTNVPLLSKGDVVLIIEDRTPWVKNRRGYDYGATRRDVVCVKNGKAQNAVISSYDTESSNPLVKYFLPSSNSKKISNITFIRDAENDQMAFFVHIFNICNLEINNIKCETPLNQLKGDRLIKITDCANIIFKDITINGSYSQKKNSGYGISMNNVTNVTFYRLIANANWGIFGNNNVNNIKLIKCDINRFDVHCYGRDVFFKDCKFRYLYNQFSSMYGTVSFKKCEFFDFTPVLFEPSYNAYTKFDLVFRNCIIHARRGKNCLISAGELRGDKTEERVELSKQEYPNLYINGLEIEMPDKVDVYYLYKFKKALFQSKVGSIPGIIQLKKIQFSSPGKKLDYIDPLSWMTAMELSLLSLAGSGVVVSCISTSQLFKNKINSLSS